MRIEKAKETLMGNAYVYTRIDSDFLNENQDLDFLRKRFQSKDIPNFLLGNFVSYNLDFLRDIIGLKNNSNIGRGKIKNQGRGEENLLSRIYCAPPFLAPLDMVEDPEVREKMDLVDSCLPNPESLSYVAQRNINAAIGYFVLLEKQGNKFSKELEGKINGDFCYSNSDNDYHRKELMERFIVPMLEASNDCEEHLLKEYGDVLLDYVDSKNVFPFFKGITNLIKEEPDIRKMGLIKKTIDLTDKISNEEYEEAAKLKTELEQNPLYQKYISKKLRK